MINQDLIFHVSMLQVNGSTFHTFSILQQIPSQIGTSWMSGSIEAQSDSVRKCKGWFSTSLSQLERAMAVVMDGNGLGRATVSLL